MFSIFVCVAFWTFQLRVYNSHTFLSDILFSLYIYDISYGVVEMMNVNKDHFVSSVCIVVTCTETIVNAAGFALLVYVYSCSTVQVRGYTIVLFYLTHTDLNQTEYRTGNLEYQAIRRTVKM